MSQGKAGKRHHRAQVLSQAVAQIRLSSHCVQLCTDLSPLWAHPSHSNKGSDCLIYQKIRTKLDPRVDLRFTKANVCLRAG